MILAFSRKNVSRLWVCNTSIGRSFGLLKYPDSQRTGHMIKLPGDGEEHSQHNRKELDAPLPMRWEIELSTATEGKVHW